MRVGRSRERLRQKMFYSVLAAVYEASPISLPERLVEEVVRRLRGRRRVLDVGCATGYLTRRLARHCSEVVGVDVNARMIRASRARTSRENVRFLRADAHDLPLPDGYFDGVVLSEVLQHLNLRVAAREVTRVTARGARAVIVLPNPASRVARAATRLIHLLTGNNEWVSCELVAAAFGREWRVSEFEEHGDRVMLVLDRVGGEPVGGEGGG